MRSRRTTIIGHVNEVWVPSRRKRVDPVRWPILGRLLWRVVNSNVFWHDMDMSRKEKADRESFNVLGGVNNALNPILRNVSSLQHDPVVCHGVYWLSSMSVPEKHHYMDMVTSLH